MKVRHIKKIKVKNYMIKKKKMGREANISSCYHFHMRIRVISPTSIMGEKLSKSADLLLASSNYWQMIRISKLA